MTDKLREAAKMALDALEQVQEADTAGATPKMVMEARKLYEPTITALRAALAQPETPYLTGARLFREGKGISFIQTAVRTDADIGEALQGWEDAKTSEEIAQPEQEPPCKTGSQCVGNKCERCAVQPEREWQRLTDEERQECLYSDPIFGRAASTFARAIEAKLKEKNGAI